MQLLPVFAEAAERSPIGLQFVQPPVQQGMHPRATDCGKVRTQSVAAIGSDQFHLQIVAGLDALRPAFLHRHTIVQKGTRGLANHFRRLASRRGDSVIREKRKPQSLDTSACLKRHGKYGVIAPVFAQQNGHERGKILDTACHRTDLP